MPPSVSMSSVCAVGLATSTALPALGITPQVSVSQGIEFVTVGDPGNEGFYLGPVLGGPDTLGAVDYSYRIATREVTVREWHDFVTAYAPYAEDPWGISLLSTRIVPTTPDGVYPVQYTYLPAAADAPIAVTWRNAARYVNWLQNNKGADAASFETGVYDTSTFGRLPDGTVTDQAVHTLGATYWIPTLDEWTKAMYYDPDRQGSGSGGWWLYPNGGDDPLVPGYPELGGETNAGIGDQYNQDGRHSLTGDYPNVRSPWGVLDGSGGFSEWLENKDGGTRWYKGTNLDTLDVLVSSEDQIYYWARDGVAGAPAHIGLRIAATIPAPPVCFVFFLFGVGANSSRYRRVS